jgi:hypothetical protein
MKESSYLCPHITEVLIMLSLNTQISFTVVSLKIRVQQSFLHLQHTRNHPSLDGFISCVAVLALDLDTPVSTARRFSDFLGICSSLAPTSSSFSSVRTRSLCFCFLSIKICCSKSINQIMNRLVAENSFITKFTPKFLQHFPVDPYFT